MQCVVTKSAKALRIVGRSGKPFLKEGRVGKHELATLLQTRRRLTKMNQFANWNNIAAGIHSTTSSEFRLFPRLTSSWILTTDHQFSGLYIVVVWRTACTVQKAR